MAGAVNGKLFEKIIRFLSTPLCLVLVLGSLYALTLAPDLTWANRGADGGDLITAAATGGVPHPSGYPTYLILAKFFQWVPLGTLAFRTNLMSAVCAVLVAMVAADLARRSFEGPEPVRRGLGVFTGLAFGLSPLFWSQAVITEVYTLHLLFVALILRLTPLSGEHSPKWRPWLDRLGGLLFGLALGNQLTVIFLLPPWLLSSTRPAQGRAKQRQGFPFWLASHLDWRSLLRRGGWLLLGLAIYLTIPIRARSGSPVIWGNPVDWDGLWWLISGQLYQERVFSLSPEYVWPRIRNWAGWLQTQYGLVGLVLGFFGLFYGQPRDRRFFWITGWVFAAYSVFAIGYASSDSYALLIPAYLAFGLWLGLGVAKLIEASREIRRMPWLPSLVGALAVLLVMVNAGLNFRDVDASQDDSAVVFGSQVIETAPPGAIVLTEEDTDTFTLWYYHFALGQRPDIAVLTRGLFPYPWYLETLTETYPDLVIPNPNECLSCKIQSLRSLNDRPFCETRPSEPRVLICEP